MDASRNRALAHPYNVEYPHRLWYISGGFIALVSFFRFGSLVHSKFFASRKPSADIEHNGAAVRHTTSLKRFPLAVVNMYRILAFRWTFTLGSYSLNMAEVFLTIAYIVSAYTLEFVNTTGYKGDKLNVSFWLNRAATLAVSQLPLLTVLGTKNNPLAFLTGISYEKLNYMHRMVGRVVISLVWIHAGTRLSTITTQYLMFKEDRVGLTAAISAAIIFLVSLRPIRAGAYELFFFIHFLMVVVFLACGYIHTQDNGFSVYFWPCFLIWGLDRFLRFVRLIVFNHSYFGLKSGSGTMDASVELLSPHFVRLRLRRPAHFHWKAGQTAYLTLPGVSGIPFEAHPFTIASIDTTPEECKEKKELEISAPYWKELVFFINIHGGFTKRLGEVAAKGGRVKAFVDGPYGHASDLTTEDTVVLIAGGSGISFTLPLLLDTINKVSAGKSRTRRVLFIWAIRDPNHLVWISETLSESLKVAPATLSISIRIFITSPNSLSTLRQWDDVSVSSGSEGNREKSRAASLLETPSVQIAEGSRPDLPALLQEEADMTTGRMHVSMCGSQAVARAVKDALGFSVAGPSSIMKGGPNITLHTEAFGYA